jgi:hypothetical protein
MPPPSCPDIWKLDNGDIAIIGRDMTARSIQSGCHRERLVHTDLLKMAMDDPAKALTPGPAPGG